MTSGTKIVDNRATVPLYTRYLGGTESFEGNGLTGGYYWKQWTGTNSPPRTKVYEDVYYWLPGEKRPRKRRRLVRLPRRARFDDHPYTMQLNMYSDRVFSYKFTNALWPEDPSNITDAIRTYRLMFGGLPSNIRYGTLWDGNDDIALIGKLRESIAGSDFNAGVFLGEGRQSLRLIADSATRIYQSLWALRRGNMPALVEALSLKTTPKLRRSTKYFDVEMGKVWLEVQYGWLPLLKDAESGAQMLAQLLKFPLVQTYRVRKQKSQILDLPVVSWLKNGSFAYSSITRGQLLGRISEVNVPQLVGLTDPASVAWELVPFSFVADWFIPIGNYLAARGLSQALTGTFVTTTTRTQRFTVSGLSPPNRMYGMITQPDYHETYISMTRNVSTTISVPKPNFKPLAKVASWQHCANAVALLATTFGSKRKE